MAKTKEELTEDELKLISGGSGQNGYKYSFRSNDYVFVTSTTKEIFMIDENIDTNDDGCRINGHKATIGVKERDVRESTMSASAIYSCYINNGGKLNAMN